jgi:hypothetical protein
MTLSSSTPLSLTLSELSSLDDDELGVLAMVLANSPYLFKQLCYTSPYTGYDWVKELIHPETHPDQICKSLGI